MKVPDAAIGIYELAKRVAAPTALQHIGIDYNDLNKIVALVMEAPPENPEPVTKIRLRALLEYAYHGREPQSIA
jgi:alcohol dehydrogenase class IV